MHLCELKGLNENVLFYAWLIALVEGIMFPGQRYLLLHLVNSYNTSLITTNLGQDILFSEREMKTSYVATVQSRTSGTKGRMVTMFHI